MEVNDNVKVVVRCRPLNQKEQMMGCKQSVTVDETRRSITVRKLETPNALSKTFTFDTVFGPDSKQPDVYNLTARPIIDSVLEGYNGTIFAYGQTGTGKTFTMEGVKVVPELRGIIPNSFAHVFSHIAKAEGDTRFLVRVSYLEIYNEELRDLLGKDQVRRLELKERQDAGIYIKDLSVHVMKNADDMDQIMSLGHKNRSVGATNMNKQSSRSHAIFTITVKCSEKGSDGDQHVRMGKLHLVDLAGSERQSKTGATGQRLREATKINLSLSNLGNVISALVDGKSTHVPYRNSKLTYLLKDSLGGNCKTMMYANIGPADYNHDETICTLRYANRAKNIKNKARINEDPKDALIRQLQQDIEELKKKLKEGKEISWSEGNGSENMDGGVDKAGDGGERPRKRQGKNKESPDKMAEFQVKIVEEGKVPEAKLKKGKAEQNKVHAELERREKDLLKVQQEHQQQFEKLEKLFALKKMIVGGVDLLAELEEQVKLLEKSNSELMAQQEKNKQLCGELEETEQEKEIYTRFKEVVLEKTKRSKKVWTRVESEMSADQRWENQSENIRQHRRKLGLLTQTTDKFIPQPSEVDFSHVYYSYPQGSQSQSLMRLERPRPMTASRKRLSRLDIAIKHLIQ